MSVWFKVLLYSANKKNMIQMEHKGRSTMVTFAPRNSDDAYENVKRTTKYAVRKLNKIKVSLKIKFIECLV